MTLPMILLLLAVGCIGPVILDYALFPWESPRHWFMDRYNTIGKMIYNDWEYRE